MGITKLNFNEYLYFFKLEVSDITKFQYASLKIVGSVFLSIVVILYSIWMKHYETRTLLRLCLFVEVLGSLSDFAFTRQWYETLGVSPFTFIFFTSSTLDAIVRCLYMIPPYVLIAKLTPDHVEATIFSFSASIVNLCAFLIPRMMGVVWSKLTFNVTSENLTDLWKLYILEFSSILLCLLYVRLLPTWEEVEEAQDDIKRVSEEVQAQMATNSNSAALNHGIQDSQNDHED